MVSTAVSVIAPLAFVIVLELVQLARDVPIPGATRETERIDYELSGGSPGEALHLLARHFPFITGILSGGAFYVFFTLTELVLYGSVLVVYGASAPVIAAPAVKFVPFGVLAFLSLVWLLLPVMVVRRYDDLVDEGVEPFSKNVHATTTAVYVLAIVAFAEMRSVLDVGLPDGILGFTAGVGAALIGSAKWRLFWRHLRTELDRLEPSAGPVDDGHRSDGG